MYYTDELYSAGLEDLEWGFGRKVGFAYCVLPYSKFGLRGVGGQNDSFRAVSER